MNDLRDNDILFVICPSLLCGRTVLFNPQTNYSISPTPAMSKTAGMNKHSLKAMQHLLLQI